jgi:tetratricopeptide (TPR) repeat protein
MAAEPPSAVPSHSPPPALPADSPLSSPTAPPLLRVLPTGGLRAETAALLLSGQEGGLPLAVLALPIPGGIGGTGGDAGQTRVPISVEVDGAGLLAGHEEETLHIEICLYALGPGGGVEASLLDTVEISPAGLARLERGGLQFRGELLLPPGETSLRVLVRNPATRSVGLKRLTLTVPSFHAGPPTLLPPLFAAPAEAWLVAAAPGAGRAETAAARPVLSPGGEIAFQALTYRLGPELPLTAEMKKRGGERTIELPVRTGERTATGSPDFERIAATATLTGIEPGEYELRLVASPAGGGPLRSAALPVVVSPGGAGRTWAALGASGSTGGETAGNTGNAGVEAVRQTGRGKHRKVATGPLKAAYREALRPLTAGDEAGARAAQAAVAAFETAHLVTDPEPIAPEDLVDVQARVVGELTRRDPEAIVPLLLLYERLYHETLGRHAYLLANHDGELVFGLAELYVRKSHSKAAKELAAGFLVDLARDQLGVTITLFTRRALSRALVYDEGNEAALLALAVDAGRRGDVRTAAGFLDRLVRRHPESLEARLRLGIARDRLGDGAKARQLLSEVLAVEPPTEERWLLSLAYQELARLELTADDPGAAARTVEAGLARLPGDEELLLEQASLLDRSGEHGRARETLEAIQGRADSGSTPRHRYNQPPDGAFDRAWRSLEARATRAEKPSAPSPARSPGGAP